MERGNKLNVTIGRRIHEARESAGITQEHLAEMIGIGEKSLSAVERGVSGISINTLYNVCEHLSVTSDSLLFGEPYEKSEMQKGIDTLNLRLIRMKPETLERVLTIFTCILNNWNV